MAATLESLHHVLLVDVREGLLCYKSSSCENFVLDLQFSYLEQRLSACRDVKN